MVLALKSTAFASLLLAALGSAGETGDVHHLPLAKATVSYAAESTWNVCGPHGCAPVDQICGAWGCAQTKNICSSSGCEVPSEGSQVTDNDDNNTTTQAHWSENSNDQVLLKMMDGLNGQASVTTDNAAQPTLNPPPICTKKGGCSVADWAEAVATPTVTQDSPKPLSVCSKPGGCTWAVVNLDDNLSFPKNVPKNRRPRPANPTSTHPICTANCKLVATQAEGSAEVVWNVCGPSGCTSFDDLVLDADNDEGTQSSTGESTSEL